MLNTLSQKTIRGKSAPPWLKKEEPVRRASRKYRNSTLERVELVGNWMKFSTSNFLAYPLAVIYSEFFPSARMTKKKFSLFEAKSSKPKVTAGIISLTWTQSEGAPVRAHRNSPQRKHPTRQLGVWWSFFGGTETETNSKTDPAWSTFLKNLFFEFFKEQENKNKKIFEKFFCRELSYFSFCFEFMLLRASFWTFSFLHT